MSTFDDNVRTRISKFTRNSPTKAKISKFDQEHTLPTNIACKSLGILEIAYCNL